MRQNRDSGVVLLERDQETMAPRAAPAAGGSARWELAAIVAIMVLAAAIRLYRLTALSLWEDEGFSAYVATGPLSAIPMWCGIDFAPPLYYVLLHFWVAFFHGDFGLRFFSVACGVLAVPLIYLCGRSAHSGRAGLIAALLLALNACHVHFSQEARYYALYFAAGLLAVYFTLELGRQPTRGRWIGWVGAAALMLYTHSTAVFYVLALTPLLLAQRPSPRDPIWRGWLKAHVVLGVLFLPCAAFLLHTSLGLTGHYYPPVPTPRTLADTALQFATVPFASLDGTTFPVNMDPRLLALPFLAFLLWAIGFRISDFGFGDGRCRGLVGVRYC